MAASSPAGASDPGYNLVTHAAPDWNQLIQLQQRGADGDREAVESCIRALEAVVKSEPSNQLARVYLGSAYTLRSRDLGFGPTKLSTLKQGGALMDAAVATAPGDPHVRLVRAVTNAALPSFLGRRSFAHEELEALLALADRAETNFTAREQQLLYLHAGQIAKQNGDKPRAAELWNRGLRTPADPNLTDKLKAELARA